MKLFFVICIVERESRGVVGFFPAPVSAFSRNLMGRDRWSIRGINGQNNVLMVKKEMRGGE